MKGRVSPDIARAFQRLASIAEAAGTLQDEQPAAASGERSSKKFGRAAVLTLYLARPESPPCVGKRRAVRAGGRGKVAGTGGTHGFENIESVNHGGRTSRHGGRLLFRSSFSALRCDCFWILPGVPVFSVSCLASR